MQSHSTNDRSDVYWPRANIRITTGEAERPNSENWVENRPKRFFYILQSRNYIQSMVFSLSNRWPINQSKYFKGLYAKTGKICYPLFFQNVHKTRRYRNKITPDRIISRNAFTTAIPIISYSKISILFFVHLHHWDLTRFPTSFPVTENEFGHTVGTSQDVVESSTPSHMIFRLTWCIPWLVTGKKLQHRLNSCLREQTVTRH